MNYMKDIPYHRVIYMILQKLLLIRLPYQIASIFVTLFTVHTEDIIIRVIHILEIHSQIHPVKYCWKLFLLNSNVLYFIVLKGWSLLPNALQPFQIYCAPPNLCIRT